MAGFPDIRLYKSDYTAEEAKNISKEKGSIVFSTKTKRLYVAKEQFGSNVQDILWNPDADNKKYKIEVKQVDPKFNVTLCFNDNDKSIYVTAFDKASQKQKTTRVAKYGTTIDDIKIKENVLAKNTVTGKDEVIINKGDSIQDAVQILARQFEKNFVWKEWQDEN